MSDLLTKARISARSARLLLKAGDADGAVNRAYYAMFDAARAALASIDPALLNAKTHATVIRRFGKHVVEGCGFERSLGRAFSQTESVRIAADYDEEHVDQATAQTIVGKMEEFVAAVEEFLDEGKA